MTIPKNSVGTSQIKKGGVANSDMRTNAVTGAKVKNRSLAADFALGQLPIGPAGPTGATGATGAAGPTGPQGPTGVVGAVTVQRTDFGLTDGTTSGVSVPCPAGTRAIGGGSSIADYTDVGTYATASRPDRPGVAPDAGETFNGWRVSYRNETGAAARRPCTRSWSAWRPSSLSPLRRSRSAWLPRRQGRPPVSATEEITVSESTQDRPDEADEKAPKPGEPDTETEGGFPKEAPDSTDGEQSKQDE